MRVVRREAVRRWSVVSAGVAVLAVVPAVVAAWPEGSAAGPDPVELRERILASADRPHDGYVATDGRLGLPALPELEDVGGLLGGSARLRVWYAGSTSWRVAELTTTGERDTYRTAAGLYRWDFERNLVTHLAGEPTVWLPGAADLVPPALARRLLGGDGRLDRLPSRRIAGIEAAGLRLTPHQPDTTVGRVDVWADRETGLPLVVDVAGKNGAHPVFTSRFLQLRQATPPADVLTPAVPDGAGFAMTTTDEVADALATALPGRLPDVLAGRARTATAAGVGGGAVYGTGFSTVAVLALPGRVGGRMLGSARDAGGTPVPLAGAQAYELRTALLTALVVRTDGDRRSRRGWLLAGLVDPQLLRRAATELIGRP
ncbi:MAG TPA: hypothetical protein VHI50_06850 [Micromonosporaceae bacterium]|nr:hypothetical protein [Micromonosporaceae bacterium]